MGAPGLSHSHNTVVPLLAEVGAHVEVAAEPRGQVHVVYGVVLGQRYEARREPRVGVLGPLAQHLTLPAGGVAGELRLDHLDDLGAQGPVGRHGLGVLHPVRAKSLVRRVVKNLVEDAVGVPGRALGYEVAVRRVQGEEHSRVKVLVVADEVALHEVYDLSCVAPDGLRHR